ncbi:MAG: glycosyltransferase family 2 protein [Patescibacteria group bacterium]
MKLAVGFITYNESSAGYLADFLPSLETALGFLSPDDYRIYVFDNSTPDDRSNRNILENYNAGVAGVGPDAGAVAPRRPLRIMTQGGNLGFSRAYNLLIEAALADRAQYFLIVNPDTLWEADALEKLVAALDNDATLASVSPKIRCWDFVSRQKTTVIDSLGLLLEPGLRFLDLGQGAIDRGQFDQAQILGPSGAAGLFRLSALVRVAIGDSRHPQYFDERFFMYKEDCDLAYRLFLFGFASALVPAAVVYHDRTAAASGRGLWHLWRDRGKKSRAVRAWSFHNQHLIFVKYWTQQNTANKIMILFRVLSMFIFSLILERFLLKEYRCLGRELKG